VLRSRLSEKVSRLPLGRGCQELSSVIKAYNLKYSLQRFFQREHIFKPVIYNTRCLKLCDKSRDIRHQSDALASETITKNMKRFSPVARKQLLITLTLSDCLQSLPQPRDFPLHSRSQTTGCCSHLWLLFSFNQTSVLHITIRMHIGTSGNRGATHTQHTNSTRNCYHRKHKHRLVQIRFEIRRRRQAMRLQN